MKKWLLLFVFVIAPLVGLIYWRLTVKKAETAAQDTQRKARLAAPPAVKFAVVTTKDIVHTFDGVASIESPFNLKVSPKVTGRLLTVLVREGDVVKAGQVLATIDPADVDSEIARSKATVAEAKSRLAQAQLNQSPTDTNILSEIRKQEAAVASAQADYNQAKQNFNSQVSSAESAVIDTQGRVNVAQAAMNSAESSIRSAQANLDNSKSKFARVTDLYKQGFIAAQDVDDARTMVSQMSSGVEVANGALASAKAQKDSATAQKGSAQQQVDIVKTKGKADIDASLARLKSAQASLDYAKANRAQKPAFQANLDALRSAVDAADAALRTSEAHRTDTILTSTVDGRVTGRFMDPGATAVPGNPVISVQSVKMLWASAPVPEESSRYFYLGQPATVTVDALPNKTFSGKVVQINPSADAQSRQFLVRIGLENAANELKAGMYAHVHAVLNTDKNALIIPREAMGPGGIAMVLDEKNVAHKTLIKTVPADEINVQVTGGLQLGQRIVVLSAFPVKDGQTVKISEGNPKP
ncbi:MAG: efflux RND transporter periplasmic adaptor subunit [Chthonomonadales bacterium]